MANNLYLNRTMEDVIKEALTPAMIKNLSLSDTSRQANIRAQF